VGREEERRNQFRFHLLKALGISWRSFEQTKRFYADTHNQQLSECQRKVQAECDMALRDPNLPCLTEEVSLTRQVLVEMRLNMIAMKVRRERNSEDKLEIGRRIKVQSQKYLDELYLAYGFTRNQISTSIALLNLDDSEIKRKKEEIRVKLLQ
jgi:hypothetical protein